LFHEKSKRSQTSKNIKNKNNQLESHTKWRVSSEINIERDARSRYRGVQSGQCAISAVF